MPLQRRHLADIDHELERNFLNLSELKSNKRKRSENKNVTIGNMVKTMAVIPTQRKSSGTKATPSSRSKTKRLTVPSTISRKSCVSPGLDSSTAYDPSTSPTYYTSSTVASGSRAKQRNCSPLPAWLANTFSGLVRNHPLRLLLPGNPSPPASPSPVVYRRPSLPPPPSARESGRPIAKRLSPPPPSPVPRLRKKARTKENEIFAFDPFDVADEEAVPPPERQALGKIAPDFGLQVTDTVDNYPAQVSPQPIWPVSAEQYHPEQRRYHDDYDPTSPLEPTYYARDQHPYDYAAPGIAIPLAPLAPLAPASPDPLPNYQLDAYEEIIPDSLPPRHRSELSVALRCDSPIDEPDLPGSQYVAQLYKTRGPASTIEVSAPRSQPFYFDSPTEDPFSSPSPPATVSAFVQEHSEYQVLPASVVQDAQFSAFCHAPPINHIASITEPCVPEDRLEFSWKKFDRNGILVQGPSATKKPIYQLPPSDDDGYSEISSALPSLLLGTGNVVCAPKMALSDSYERLEKEVRNPYETPAPNVQVTSSNAQYGQGPRFVRPSQSSDQSKSDRGRRDPPAIAAEIPVAGTQAPPSTPIRRGVQVTVQVVSTPAELEEDTRMEMAESGKDGEVKTPNSYAIFAPAPGIYISPLRGSDTNNEAAEETAKRPDSQSSDDSIRSWSDRL